MIAPFVMLSSKRQRGWPFPLDKRGFLSAMYGDDGWCRGCGVPKRGQQAGLQLTTQALTVVGAWEPYGYFRTMCFERSLADEIEARFNVKMWDIIWPRKEPGSARHLEIPTWGDKWFDPSELESRAQKKEGMSGAFCGACGVWKWRPFHRFPTPYPQFLIADELEECEHDVIASPETFGFNLHFYNVLLFRRELAELIIKASPRDFKIVEIQ